jgi:nardilysin
MVLRLREIFNSDAIDYEYDVKNRGYELPIGQSALRILSPVSKDDNSVSKMFFQAGPESIRLTALLRLLESILDPKAFDFLRTKEQLGYNVGVQYEKHSHILGLSLSVSSQEHKHSYVDVLGKMETFMREVARKAIEDLSDEDFQSFKDARVQTLQAQDLELLYVVHRRWNEITEQENLFDRAELSIKVTKLITKAELQEFFESLTGPNSRKLIIQILGNRQENPSDDQAIELKILDLQLAENEKVITNILSFQNDLRLFPLTKSVI